MKKNKWYITIWGVSIINIALLIMLLINIDSSHVLRVMYGDQYVFIEKNVKISCFEDTFKRLIKDNFARDSNIEFVLEGNEESILYDLDSLKQYKDEICNYYDNRDFSFFENTIVISHNLFLINGNRKKEIRDIIFCIENENIKLGNKPLMIYIDDSFDVGEIWQLLVVINKKLNSAFVINILPTEGGR